MKAIRIHRYGGPEVLELEEAATPDIASDEVLVKVHAAGVNVIDWKTRQGFLRDFRPYAFPLILGWDIAGTVERAGEAATSFRRGDRVFGWADISRNGGYAEYIAARAADLAPAPLNISLEQAAAIPLAAATAWSALFDAAHLAAGQSLLVHAASGGVGSFAVQLAKHRGARVVATTSAANVEWVRSLGADEVIDYRAHDFTAKAKEIDVVLDTLGGYVQARSWRVLRRGGMLASIMGPPDEAQAKRRGVQAKAVYATAGAARLSQIAALVDAGKLRVVIDQEFPLSDAKAAHELSETGHARGKIVLRVA